jgi:hypothetical protein
LIIKKALITHTPAAVISTSTPTIVKTTLPAETSTPVVITSEPEQSGAALQPVMYERASFVTPAVIIAGALLAAGFIAANGGRRRRG